MRGISLGLAGWEYRTIEQGTRNVEVLKLPTLRAGSEDWDEHASSFAFSIKLHNSVPV
jgi:hypothetical protein